jgi:hypothetical protein
MDKFKALKSLCPTANFQLDEDNYDKLIWHSPEIDIPTLEEVEAEITRLQAEQKRTQYQRQRAPEYPSITDQLDAIWKGGDAYDAMLAKVMAVKNKYPKSE